MASKIFILCAFACAIQGLNAAVFYREAESGPTTFGNGLFSENYLQFLNLEKEYANIIDKFESVIFNVEAEFGGYFKNVLDMLSDFAAQELNEEAVADRPNFEVIRACIREQIPNYQKLATEIRQKVLDAAVELRQFIYDLLGPYIQKARQAFTVLAESVVNFLPKMWECIQSGDFLKCIDVVRETRLAITQSAATIRDSLRDASTQFPAISEKAKQLRKQIQAEAVAGLSVIRENIRKCIAEGGPKLMLPPVFPEQVAIQGPSSRPAVPGVAPVKGEHFSNLLVN